MSRFSGFTVNSHVCAHATELFRVSPGSGGRGLARSFVDERSDSEVTLQGVTFTRGDTCGGSLEIRDRGDWATVTPTTGPP